ncbi:kinase-like domain-containing protein [Hygrophoropsis aurantiaca]|uniref:Kinase-like domain-containing protein n=1 Tax=Hygrophoropsis aurantiaca TaxID=72124 RepID=A0ACB8AMY5_9AGAM|nr:kinase-like domain-containing protein [Hygrophoropsis aurantiaca]
MSAEDSLDLSTSEGVKEYLKDTVFAPHTVTRLSGGFGNFTYRIQLIAQHEGRATYVLKYAAPYVAVSLEAIPFSTDRQKFEAEALRLAEKLPASHAAVTAPIVRYFDEAAHVLIIDDCGEDLRTLKQAMVDGVIPPTLAEEIGSALGAYIGHLHSLHGDPSVDISLFETNDIAKTMSGWVTYGRLKSTLTGEDGISSLSDPPISNDIPEEDLQTISDLADARIQSINLAKGALTHGDFWPGNIMVSYCTDAKDGISKLERLYVLDWELCKVGLRGLDLGQFCAEMHLLRHFHANCREPASMVIDSFLRAYSRSQDVDTLLAQTALTHVGAHLVAWGPRVPWGDKEDTRAVVKEGVNMLTGGVHGTEEWLRKQLIGPLLQANAEAGAP